MEDKPLDQGTFDAGRLIREHPPRWRDGNKRLVFEIGCSSGFPFEGQVAYALWTARELPAVLETRPQFLIREGVFEYAVPTEPTKVPWHLNFADPTLFVAYESSLLAQDELQVAEHPVLGSLREALDAMGKVLFTIGERGGPTPVTITGVQRRCAIDTRPNPRAGRSRRSLRQLVRACTCGASGGGHQAALAADDQQYPGDVCAVRWLWRIQSGRNRSHSQHGIYGIFCRSPRK